MFNGAINKKKNTNKEFPLLLYFKIITYYNSYFKNYNNKVPQAQQN